MGKKKKNKIFFKKKKNRGRKKIKILGKGKFECKSHYNAFYYKKNNNYILNLNLNN